MKKFNLFNEIITVNKTELLSALNTSKEFGINIKGEIKFAPFADKEILIYQGKYTSAPTSALMPQKVPSLAEIFGRNYQIVEDDDRVLIKAFSNWQTLIKVNTPRASYDDTTGDGVDKFANKALEDIGWHATDFNINYRTLVEILENECDGTLLCIEQEDPYQFSGLGYLDDDEQAQKILFEYCQNKIKEIIANDPLYAKDNLSDDEEEAAEFFKCL
ncbi:hypothetical protein [Sulfurimonas sp.]|uniref:hypothetical protein n=1 Tax=Sulfurimonas sp. TaxID=2022749 RepID=UPI0026279A09|nr:hypothetical protein [Sulfurimonas sp.]